MYVVFNIQTCEDCFPVSLCMQVVSVCGQVITEEVFHIKPRHYLQRKYIDERNDGTIRTVNVCTALKYLFAYTSENAVYVTIRKRDCVNAIMVAIAHLYLNNMMETDEAEYMFKQLIYIMVHSHCLSTNALSYVGLPSPNENQLFSYPTITDLCDRFHVQYEHETHPLGLVSLASQCYFIGRELGVYWF
tara:strand:- start:6706 stop:7272 length:567 start_codon:yes stop_codon:yes gene_type:complete